MEEQNEREHWCHGKHWREHPHPLKIVCMVIVGLITACVFALVFGYFVMMLWNWLMPSLFGLVKINFWQAFGLVFLARLLFGSTGHCQHKWHKKWHNHYYGEEDDWYVKGGWKKWHYYDAWWQDEGKEAFDNYVKEKMHKEEK